MNSKEFKTECFVHVRRVVANPKSDSAELFRRMCFNALISNIDDHPRHQAFIALDQKWKLSPAYDLTPSPSVSQRRDLAMVCVDMGRLATAENVLASALDFCLAKTKRKRSSQKMTAQIKHG